MLDYIFKKALFTKVFWKLRDAKKWYVINRGGADSSKSWSQAQHEIIELLSDKRLFYARLVQIMKDQHLSR